MSENKVNEENQKEMTASTGRSTQVPGIRFRGMTAGGDEYLLSVNQSAFGAITHSLANNGFPELAKTLFEYRTSDSSPELLHQGDEVSGSNKEGDRRWIAVILHEEEIRNACESRGIKFSSLSLDAIVERYTEALLCNGDWYEMLKTIVADEGEEKEEEEDAGASTDTDTDLDDDPDFGEYTIGKTPCSNCGSNRETEYVPACDKNPRGLNSQKPEEHGNMQEDGTVLCDDNYCNPREITMKEFRTINGKEDANPQDVIVRCHDCNTIKE